MPILEAESKYSKTFLIALGIPLFVLATALSVFSHQYAHIAVKKYSCGNAAVITEHDTSMLQRLDDQTECPAASLAGISTTFFIAILSFGLFINHPRNVFLASMAFINASSRLPETIGVFLQLLFTHKTTLVVDESIALKLMHFSDHTASTVILCFYTLISIFLTFIIIHDTKIISHKWLVAIILFIALFPLENFLWNLFTSFFPTSP